MAKKRRAAGTGCVFLRGRHWYFRAKGPDGKIVMRSLRDPLSGERPTTKGHAQRIANALATSIISGGKLGLNGAQSERVLLADLDKSYLEAFAGQWDDKRQNHHLHVMSQFIAAFPEVNAITHERLGRYVAQCKSSKSHVTGKPVSAATINRALAELRRVLNWSVQTGKIERNPMQGFRFLKEPNSRERILTQEERRRLLETLEEERFTSIKPMVRIALFCGLRFGEIASLEWSDIDESRREFDLLVTKSGKRRRVPIPATLLEELRALRKESESRFVFPSPRDPEKPVGPIKTSFHTLLRVAGIESLRFHDLRHTAASLMLSKGADIRTVQEILGHASIVTTQRYLTSLEDAKRAAVDSVADDVGSEGRNTPTRTR